MFSVATLTESDAAAIAESYFKGDKDPVQMAQILGVDSFDLNILMHPLVRRYIVQAQREVSVLHTLAEHYAQLKKIRDAAYDDENWKVALQAETQIGKVMGHYEPKTPGEEGLNGKLPDPKKMSIEELKRKVAAAVGAVIPIGEAGQLEDQSEDSSQSDDEGYGEV